MTPEPKWNQDLEPLMKALLNTGGLKTRQASEVGRRAVEYFRGQDFCTWLLKNEETLKAKAPVAFENIQLKTSNDCADVANRLISNGFIYRAQYKPIAGSTGTEKRPKWPKRLSMSQQSRFDENDFYVIVYEGNKSWSYLLLALMISAVLLMCLFPAWPVKARLAVV
eukprot:Platyproteum_vivax@DN11172_c0_g1_i1.p1